MLRFLYYSSTSTTFHCWKTPVSKVPVMLSVEDSLLTWSAICRHSLSSFDPASEIFLAALMTSMVFFRGPRPLHNDKDHTGRHKDALFQQHTHLPEYTPQRWELLNPLLEDDVYRLWPPGLILSSEDLCGKAGVGSRHVKHSLGLCSAVAQG